MWALSFSKIVPNHYLVLLNDWIELQKQDLLKLEYGPTPVQQYMMDLEDGSIWKKF